MQGTMKNCESGRSPRRCGPISLALLARKASATEGRTQMRRSQSSGASMGWWFGRKSAPADARPFVPAWLCSDTAEEGFARSYDAQFEEVYRRNPVGQRAVRLVSGMLGALTIDALEGDNQAVELVQADGLLETITANLLLQGNAYVQL